MKIHNHPVVAGCPSFTFHTGSFSFPVMPQWITDLETNGCECLKSSQLTTCPDTTVTTRFTASK